MLDTNACIDFLDGRSSLLEARVEKYFGHLWVSMISVAELMVGSEKSTNPRRDAERLDAFVAGVELADFDLVAARRYGQVIKQIGVRRKSYDRLIGVQALVLGHTLVTRDGKDFADVPGLKVENWTV
ncbi:MAG TPA: type II toxin-antitoxin system VapC family toxin [Novosphingobium sp.]|nr:type II toxin-antitoxin system VapC family toxin [Novosphingobium sp.]